ncbi:MAG: 3,4-dihydroxy-2-butanone-4-phosphate synthase [Solirubrobacteraceae bacterium]|nr:3,4-dihydroxy-2-butanone-4-phosphate synthase [Solirubrobacteraceae bacterium]
MTALAAAAEQLAHSEPVLVGDADDATIFVAAAADTLTPATLERLHDLGRGMLVLGIDDATADRLGLARTPSAARPRVDLPFTAPIDAAAGITGGWTLSDRAHTMRVAADPASRPLDLTVPGHVHPARIAADAGHGAAPAALELARLAERAPAVSLAMVVDRAGGAARLADARRDPALARLPLASSAELRGRAHARRIGELAVTCTLPTREADFAATAYLSLPGGDAALALVHGDPGARPAPLVHAHAGCLFGDTLGSLLCSCRADLDAAIARIVADGAGVVLYTKRAATAAPLCGARQPADPAIAAGLLRRAGVLRLRLDGRDRALAGGLREHGLEVIA